MRSGGCVILSDLAENLISLQEALRRNLRDHFMSLQKDCRAPLGLAVVAKVGARNEV